MRVHRTPCNKGDVIVTRGCGNAPGAGGVISTVVVTDTKANGRVPDAGGYECRDATPTEIQAARDGGRIINTYG